MSIGEGIAYAAFWISLCVGFVAWVLRPKHQHKWVEDRQENIRRTNDRATIGWVSLCHCSECGKRQSFTMGADRDVI